MTHQTSIAKDASGKKLLIEREFNGTVEQVWKAWTDSDLLDQWWAPKPWKAVTKSMDFREGGKWLYYMLGPDGTKQHCSFNYQTIEPGKSFSGDDAFTDEEGAPNNQFPSMTWKNEFVATETGTKVLIEVLFASEEDLNKIVEMGFKEGFTMAHGNLDELLAA